MLRALKFFLPCAAALLLAGCAGYKLGAVNGTVAGDKSVTIRPFDNQTLQPRLGDAVTQALRERIQSDATFRLATDGEGEVVVTGTISKYEREGVGSLSTDAATPQNFRIRVTVHVVARERATGKVVLDRDVIAYTLVSVNSDLASSERQAMPLLGQDAAQTITALLADGTW